LCDEADNFAAKEKQMQQGEQVREQMYVHIEQWKQSGLSQKVYCEQQGVKYHVFHYWYKLYRDSVLFTSFYQILFHFIL
jgi:hypothetical protein